MISRVAFATLVLFAAARAEEEAATDSGYSSEYSTAGEGTGANGGSSEGSGKTARRQGLAEQYKYCEYDNCYELLGVNPESGPIPIKRAYRRVAAEYHPDKCPSGDIEMCREVFPKYANAYEVLSNSEMRKNYDYVLANPYEFPGFYMRYSRPKYAPKSDLRFVLLMTVLGFAGVQYYIKKTIYEQDLERIKKDPRARYQERLKEVMARSGNSSPSKLGSAKNKGAQGRGPREALKEAMAILDAGSPRSCRRRRRSPTTSRSTCSSCRSRRTPHCGSSRAVCEPAYMTRKALGMSAAEWGDLAGEGKRSLWGRSCGWPTSWRRTRRRSAGPPRRASGRGSRSARRGSASARSATRARRSSRTKRGRGWGAVARKWTWTCAQSHAVSSLASTTSACPNMDQAQVWRHEWRGAWRGAGGRLAVTWNDPSVCGAPRRASALCFVAPFAAGVHATAVRPGSGEIA